MNIEIFSHTLEVAGTLMIAFAALRVHHRVLNEHKIDKRVFRAMRKERIAGIIGVAFVVFGYLLQMWSVALY